MPKISACIVVHNEEKFIRRCLDSLKGAVDEIIIVHDGPCQDKTLEICKKYTHKIYIMPLVGEAEPHRPFSFSKAAGDWILQIDADEYLSEELRRKLRDLTKDKEAAAYTFLFEVYYRGKAIKFGPLSRNKRLCLFRKGKFEFRGEPHEIHKVNGRIKHIDLVLHHRPKDDAYSFDTFLKKEIRRAGKHAEFLIKKGLAKSPRFFYLVKSVVWLIFYFCYYYFYKGFILNGIIGLKLSLTEGFYNFFLYWFVFKRKAK